MSDQLDKIAAAQDEVSGEWGDKKIKIRGSDILNSLIGILVCSGLVLLWTGIDSHARDDAKVNVQLVDVLKEMARNQKDQTQAQRVTNCMLSIDQKDRQRQLQTCERLAR